MSAPFGIYVHVPFCRARCGYCDFNTYVPGGSVRVEGFVDAVLRELESAAAALGGLPPVATVFLGGGTPTLLAPRDIARVLAAIPRAPGAEVTVEANPETVGERTLHALRAAGATRVSIGMQSARPHVLAALDRVHAPGAPERAARAARAAGFEHVSLDLIYGAPGETDDDWRASLDAALGAGPDHVSAYALSVERGTALHRRVRRGELPAPDEEAQRRRYLIADATLAAAGFRWYELSNWAASPAARSRHNLGYRRSHHGWGAGPGAHSHVGGTRWWNVRHPARYAALLADGRSPAAGREVLGAAQRRVERVMLELRLADGLRLEGEEERAAARSAAASGLLEPGPVADGRAVLTLAGRLLADGVARTLLAA